MQEKYRTDGTMDGFDDTVNVPRSFIFVFEFGENYC